MEKFPLSWRKCDQLPTSVPGDNSRNISEVVDYSVMYEKSLSIQLELDGKKSFSIQRNHINEEFEFVLSSGEILLSPKVYITTTHLRTRDDTYVCAEELWLHNEFRFLIHCARPIKVSEMIEYNVGGKVHVWFSIKEISLNSDFRMVFHPDQEVQQEVKCLMESHDEDIRLTLQRFICLSLPKVRICCGSDTSTWSTRSNWVKERMEKQQLEVDMNSSYRAAVFGILGDIQSSDSAKGLVRGGKEKGGKVKHGKAKSVKDKGKSVKEGKECSKKKKKGLTYKPLNPEERTVINLRCVLVVQCLRDFLDEVESNIEHNFASTFDYKKRKLCDFKTNVADQVHEIADGKLYHWDGERVHGLITTKQFTFALLHIYSLLKVYDTVKVMQTSDYLSKGLKIENEVNTKKKERSMKASSSSEVLGQAKEEVESLKGEEHENILDKGKEVVVPGKGKVQTCYYPEVNAVNFQTVIKKRKKTNKKKPFGWLRENLDVNITVINSDVSTKMEGGLVTMVGLGVIARHGNGNFVFAISDLIDVDQCVIILELKGVHRAVHLAIEKDYQLCEIVTDCKYGCGAVNHPDDCEDYLKGVLKEKGILDLKAVDIPRIVVLCVEIRKSIAKLKNCSVLFMERETNFTADTISRKYKKCVYLQESDLDADVKKWYEADRKGETYPKGYGKEEA